jgi:hypothetical protein
MAQVETIGAAGAGVTGSEIALTFARSGPQAPLCNRKDGARL